MGRPLFADSGGVPTKVLACVALIAATVSVPTFGQTADDAMAMRWWNTLNGDQMVAALYGDSATAEQAAAARMMYADLGNLTKMLVNDTAYEIYGGGHFTSVGVWWETLDCRLMRVAAGDGNTADASSPFCAHYPGSGAAKILDATALEHVDVVGMALLGRDDPGMFLDPADEMAARWWNTLTADQMVAALFGSSATEEQETAAKNMYGGLDDDTRMLVNDATAEIYGAGGFASVGAWWESLDCRLMRIAAGDGNEADSTSAYCAHYPRSGAAKILGPAEKDHVDRVGTALLQRRVPGVYPTAYRPYAMRWWNALNGEQMVAALFGGEATMDQEAAAKKMYADLSDGTRAMVNNAAAEIYGGGRYTSVGLWWETLDCRLMRIAAGDGNTADPASPYCGHYPGSGLATILGEMAKEHVDYVGMALLGRTRPGNYPTPYELPLVVSGSDMYMRHSIARIVNRGGRAVEIMVEAFDDEGMSNGPVTLTVGAHQAAQCSSDDIEAGNPSCGLSSGVGTGTGHWWLRLTTTLPLDVLSYIGTDDGLLTSMHDVAPFRAGRRAVMYLDEDSANSMLRVVNPTDGTAHVRIEGVDDMGYTPGSAVEFSVPPMAARMFSSSALEEGGDGLMGALGDGMGKWRLHISSNRRVLAMSLMQTAAGHVTNLSATVPAD